MSPEELVQILRRDAGVLGIGIGSAALTTIARRSRGTLNCNSSPQTVA